MFVSLCSATQSGLGFQNVFHEIKSIVSKHAVLDCEVGDLTAGDSVFLTTVQLFRKHSYLLTFQELHVRKLIPLTCL